MIVQLCVHMRDIVVPYFTLFLSFVSTRMYVKLYTSCHAIGNMQASTALDHLWSIKTRLQKVKPI